MSGFIDQADGGLTDELGYHRPLYRLFSSGVPLNNISTSLKATQRAAGANMSVDVAIGDVHFSALTGTHGFWGFTDAITNVPITASSVVNPRVDILCVYYDETAVAAVGNNSPGALKFYVAAGTPSGTPSAPNDATIQASLGASVPFVKLAQITVGTGVTQIVNAVISDIRPGISLKASLGSAAVSNSMILTGAVTAEKIATNAIALGYIQRTSDFTTTSTAPVQVTGLTLSVTIPGGGRMAKITAYTYFLKNAVATSLVEASIWDGPVATGTALQTASFYPSINGYGTPVTMVAIVTPSAGSKTYNVGLSVSSGGNGSFSAGIAAPAFLLVELM